MADLRELEQKLVETLRASRHSIATLQGLYAIDGFDAYSRALDDGVDPGKAFDVFTDQMFQIDEAPVLASIDAAFLLLDAALHPKEAIR